MLDLGGWQVNLLHVYWLAPGLMIYDWPGPQFDDLCLDVFMERAPGRCVSCEQPAVVARIGGGFGGAKMHVGVSATCIDSSHQDPNWTRGGASVVFDAVDGRWVRAWPYRDYVGPPATNLPVFQPAPWSEGTDHPDPSMPFDGVAVWDESSQPPNYSRILSIVNGRLVLPA